MSEPARTDLPASNVRRSLPKEVPSPIAGRIAVVGVCAAGKSVLVRRLCALGYDAHHVGQEHSHVPDMWQRLTRPEVLVYLDASLAQVRRRRDPTFPETLYNEQCCRLAHARQHSQVYVHTDELTEEQVCAYVVEALKSF
ncbi:MAG: hypothetical protein H5T69_08390 [Chloroflexi bacterium]|nr:hypothetical protein [Chloroflexota bacterium]